MNCENKFKVLIVDDSVSAIQIVSGILEELYDVVFATSGEMALQILQEQRIDIVLLDVFLPGMDGYEILSRIKNDKKTNPVPVIFTSAIADPAEVEKGFELGISDFLAKPVNPTILRSKIKTHLSYAVDFVDDVTCINAIDRFYILGQEQLNRSRRDGTPITLALCQFNNLDGLADCKQNISENMFLKTIADNCCTVFREVDIASQFSDSAFIVMLHNTDRHGASFAMDKFSKTITDLDVLSGCNINHSVSIHEVDLDSRNIIDEIEKLA